MGPHLITQKDGLPECTRATFSIKYISFKKGTPPPFFELNQKRDAKPALVLRRTGFIFKNDELYFNSVRVNTGNRRISVIRNAYYFETGILAATQPRGNHEDDGPVELMFIDMKTMKARFIPYGSKIYWPLQLVEFPSEHLTSRPTLAK